MKEIKKNLTLYRILTVDDRIGDPHAHLLALKCLQRSMTAPLFESFVSLAKSQGLTEDTDGLPNAGRDMLFWDRIGPAFLCDEDPKHPASAWREFGFALRAMIWQAKRRCLA